MISATFLLLGWVMMALAGRSKRRYFTLNCVACFFFGGSLGSVLVRWIVELLNK